MLPSPDETKRIQAYMKKAETTEMRYCPDCTADYTAVYVTLGKNIGPIVKVWGE